MDRFLRSAAAKSFVGFVLSINEAMRDKPISTDISCSPAVSAVLDGLAGLSELVGQKPPVQHALRYGNPAYRCADCSLPGLCVCVQQRVMLGTCFTAELELVSIVCTRAIFGISLLIMVYQAAA